MQNEYFLPEGWLHDFLLMTGKVLVKFAEKDILAKPLDESQVLNLKTVYNLFVKVGWKTLLLKFIASSVCKCSYKLK